MADLTKWKLVPVEPTEEMVRAAFGARESVLADENTRSTWAAMLSTSPAPSLPTREEIARAIYEGRNGKGCLPWAHRNTEHKAAYLKDADAVLALFSPPSP